MARKFGSKRPLQAVTEINVTPLIDLAFALLIIFMITTPLLEQTIPLELPVESVQPSPDDPPEAEVISIDANGQVFWGEESITAAGLDERLAALAEQTDPPVIRLRADGQIAYQNVIDVLDLMRKHQLRKISLDTRAE